MTMVGCWGGGKGPHVNNSVGWGFGDSLVFRRRGCKDLWGGNLFTFWDRSALTVKISKCEVPDL